MGADELTYERGAPAPAPRCAPAGTRIPHDRPWSAYPLGTIAHDVNGGWWTRTAAGWQANRGDTFPTPAASALTVTLPVPSVTDDDVVRACRAYRVATGWTEREAALVTAFPPVFLVGMRAALAADRAGRDAADTERLDWLQRTRRIARGPWDPTDDLRADIDRTRAEQAVRAPGGTDAR